MNTHLERPCLAPSSRRHLESKPVDSSSSAYQPARRGSSRRASASLATVATLLQIASVSATSTAAVSPLRLHGSASDCAHPLPHPRPSNLPLSWPDMSRNTDILRMRGGMPYDASSVRMLASSTRHLPASFRRSAQSCNHPPEMARRAPKLSRTVEVD